MSALTLSVSVAMTLLSLAVILAFIRLVRGPSVADRIVALDLMLTTGIGLIAAYAVLTNQPAVLDAAVILALISFLGTVAFASYIERSMQK